MKALVAVLLFSLLAFAEEERLPLKSIITEVPETSLDTLKTSFSKESLPYWGVILGTTGVLYHYDEQIYSDLQKRGRDWGIGNEDNTRPVVSMGGQELLRLPSDTGSFLYFLGDGWTHASIAGGFLATGALVESNRAYNTGVMIMHGMVVSTLFNQTLKRSFGRESPEVKTSERGAWRPFPSFNDYNSKTASYDAMPSGHIMTASLTFTVIGEQYPDQRAYIYGAGALWLTALGFEMVNNGVHWASDYPLGIAMGIVIGKQSAKLGKKLPHTSSTETDWLIYPSYSQNAAGIGAMKLF